MSRARLQSVACVHAPEHQKSREFDARCHVRSRLRVEPRAASQPVSRSSVGHSKHLSMPCDAVEIGC